MDDQETAVEVETETTAEPSTDDLARDVIAEIAGEWVDTEESAEGAETAETTETEQSVEGEQTEEAATEEPVESDRGMERLVAREVELRAKEDAFKAREAEVEAIRAENEQLKLRVGKLPEGFIEDMRQRPFEALEAAGHDPEHTLRLLLAKKFEKDGKPVPDALRQEIREAQYEYKFRQQEQKLQQIELQRAQAAFVAKVESDAREYVSKMGESKDVPLVAKAAKTNPARVHSEILDEIANDARKAAGKNPNAALLTFDEAAKRVEKRWSEMAALFGTPAASTPAPDQKSTTGKTVSNNKNPKPAAPPAKPMTKAPVKSQAELEKEAIEMGVQEYRRIESARKAARQ